jgi:DNA polymerase-3 subunit beta
LYTFHPHRYPKDIVHMKVSCLQENLARGLSTVARAVAPRSTLPVLGNVLVATEDGRLRLSATNLELGITCWIGGKVLEEGSTTVPARTFVDLVNTLPNDQVDMELSVRTQSLNVRSGAFNNDIKCIDAQEFPPLPPSELDDGLTLNVDDLKEMIQQVAFAASSDDARPVLTGVLAEIDDGELTLAAADGFRLSVRTANLEDSKSDGFKAIIPARALSELSRVLSDGEETVTMLLPSGRGQVIFRGKNVEVVSQLIEGSFPDYAGIIPTSHHFHRCISESV